ncbi:hypothetical protein [Nocardia ignorata]|uniref:Uncharacterized protein n=1 Tax=Nocardia ignorata TaxID=145285 RepID=A0A4R6PV08_NOCIG|nr:hypothetical protein [Nocardia ignorata]TDP42133.1 hypothetical protein DFR75_1011243 [Nocardia ignorata]
MSGSDDKQYAQEPNELTSYPADEVAVPQPPAPAAAPFAPGQQPYVPGQPPVVGQPVPAQPIGGQFAPGTAPGQPYVPGQQPGGQTYPSGQAIGAQFPPGASPGQPYVGGQPGGLVFTPAPYPAYVPEPAETEPRVVPENIRMAFIVMLVGAAVAFLGGAYSLTDIDTVRTTLLDSSDGMFRGSSLDVLVYATVGATVVGALITVGLWIWMAFACRAGKNWARITSTIFFGFNVLSTLYAVLGMVADLGVTPGALAFTLAGFAIGLGAVVLLWNPKSAPFFAPARPAYPQYPLAGPR